MTIVLVAPSPASSQYTCRSTNVYYPDANGQVTAQLTDLVDLTAAGFTQIEGSGDIGTGAVTTAKLGSKAVTTAKIDDGAVGNTQLGTGAAIANIGAKGVLTANINDGAVTNTQIADGTIAQSKFAANVALAALVAAGLGASKSYLKTQSGPDTLLASVAGARSVLIVVTVDTTFANGDGAQPTFQIGQTGTAAKFADTTAFTGATAGTVKTFAGQLTGSDNLIVTGVAGTGTTETGGISITVLALAQ